MPTPNDTKLFPPELQEAFSHATEEEVFLFLCEAYTITNPPSQRAINLSTNFTDADLVQLCRFTSRDIVEISAVLQLPPHFETHSRYPFTREEGFFLLCIRLASTSTLYKLESITGYSRNHISECTNWMLSWIFDHWDHLLQDFASGHLMHTRLQLFTCKIKEHGTPLPNVWGFIDCTIQPIARPMTWQRICYNSHKTVHSLKYSAVKSPDGLIYHLFGPYEGRRNDNAQLNDSGLIKRCLQNAPSFCLYGDSAYPISSVLLSPFLKADLTAEERAWNVAMSARRECVEWGFADILRLWRHLTDKDNQRLLPRLLSQMYRVAVILTNIHTCLYGCQTTVYFNCPPPTLSAYLRPQSM